MKGWLKQEPLGTITPVGYGVYGGEFLAFREDGILNGSNFKSVALRTDKFR
jgi:hypothetical protein